MFKKIFFLIFLSNIVAKSEDSLQKPDEDSDLEHEYLSHFNSHIIGNTNEGTLRNKNKIQDFLDKNIIFARNLPNDSNTMHLDGIKHTRFAINYPRYSEMKNIEDDFKHLISMVDYKLIYKRGVDWRTWRSVRYPNGSEVNVCYKCHNTGDVSPKDCNRSGFWTIEEQPPCPYEIFSMRTKDTFCVFNYALMTKKLADCLQLLHSNDLTAACDNPIITTWIFDKIYSADSERPSIIADGRETFEIRTVYKISASDIVFRIVDDDHRVIYSKIMTGGDVDFACVGDCGHFEIMKKI